MFYAYPTEDDMPPELSNVYGFNGLNSSFSGHTSLNDFGVLPLYLIAGGIAAGAALVRFLESDEWSAGEYNAWMLKIDQTLHTWNDLGWSSKCWNKHPAKRKEFLGYWARFSKHYGTHGKVTSGWVTDSEEKPARELLRELVGWGEWLNTHCGIDTGTAVVAPPEPPKPEPEWMGLVKWGALGLAAVAALSVFSGVRSAFPPAQR
jgi:hypothetical protein